MVQPKFVFLDLLSALSVQVQYKKVSNDEFCKNCLSKQHTVGSTVTFIDNDELHVEEPKESVN